MLLGIYDGILGVVSDGYGSQVGSPRGKDNAHKALEMLAAERGDDPHSSEFIPPTSPVEHDIGSRKRIRKNQPQLAPQSSPIYTTPTSTPYRADAWSSRRPRLVGWFFYMSGK
jgi:hypothetical protein